MNELEKILDIAKHLGKTEVTSAGFSKYDWVIKLFPPFNYYRKYVRETRKLLDDYDYQIGRVNWKEKAEAIEVWLVKKNE